MINYTFDDEAKAIYVYINENPVEYTLSSDDEMVYVDYSEDGNVVGVEILL